MEQQEFPEALTVPHYARREDGRLTEEGLARFRARMLEAGRVLYRDLPWRRVRDPYAVLVSEVMLQQTQVSRVLDRWSAWILEFPTVQVLAEAPVARVLEAWQGLGYNRRALGLRRTAETCCERYGGALPRAHADLVSLPGVGPATAAGVRAFAFGEPDVFLETNVRTVMLYELFRGEAKVPDSQLAPLVAQTCDDDDPRRWYYALLDYGAYLKKTVPNPSRRSAHHARQSRFEGSHRQKRSFILRLLLDAQGVGALDVAQVAAALGAYEQRATRPAPSFDEVRGILDELARDGMAQESDQGLWTVTDR